MSIDVGFRGVMLFVKDAKSGVRLERVVLPLAEAVTPRDGSPGRHADGSSASNHRAGVVVFADGSDNPAIVERVTHLRAPGADALTVVRLSDGSSGKTTFVSPGTGAHLDEVVNGTHDIRLNVLPDVDPALTPEDRAELDARVAAIVHVTGGRMLPSTFTPPKWEGPNAKLPWSFPFEFNPGHGMHGRFFTFWYSWRTDRPTATLEIERQGETVQIPLTSGQRAYIYNHDVMVPGLDELNDPDSGDVPNEAPVDIDFRWIYQVLRPQHHQTLKWHSLQEWMAQVGVSLLPAPECDEAMLIAMRNERMALRAREERSSGTSLLLEHPSVSTCFPGLWP